MGKGGSCRCCCCIPRLRGRSPRFWFCVAVFAFVFGVLLLLLGFWAKAFHKSMSPVYTDVQCHVNFPTFKTLTLRGGLSMDFMVSTECHNPNPYAVTLHTMEGRSVYIGENMLKVANLNSIPETTLPSHGSGKIDAFVTWKPDHLSDIGKTISTLLTRGPKPIFVEVRIAVKVDIDFLVTHMKMGTTFQKDCGFNLELKLFRRPRIGPFSCAQDWDHLTLLPVEEAFHGDLILYQAPIAGNEIKAGTLAKDIGLGLAMASGFGIGSLMILLGVFGVYLGSKKTCYDDDNQGSARKVVFRRRERHKDSEGRMPSPRRSPRHVPEVRTPSRRSPRSTRGSPRHDDRECLSPRYSDREVRSPRCDDYERRSPRYDRDMRSPRSAGRSPRFFDRDVRHLSAPPKSRSSLEMRHGNDRDCRSSREDRELQSPRYDDREARPQRSDVSEARSQRYDDREGRDRRHDGCKDREMRSPRGDDHERRPPRSDDGERRSSWCEDREMRTPRGDDRERHPSRSSDHGERRSSWCEDHGTRAPRGDERSPSRSPRSFDRDGTHARAPPANIGPDAPMSLRRSSEHQPRPGLNVVVVVEEHPRRNSLPFPPSRRPSGDAEGDISPPGSADASPARAAGSVVAPPAAPARSGSTGAVSSRILSGALALARGASGMMMRSGSAGGAPLAPRSDARGEEAKEDSGTASVEVVAEACVAEAASPDGGDATPQHISVEITPDSREC